MLTTYFAELTQDSEYALRMLRRTPGFAAVAVMTLALGIGASTAIFTVVNAVLLRPLNFAGPERLTTIRPSSGSRLSPAYLDEWRRESRAFQSMAGWFDVRVNLTGNGAPLEVLADRVTTNFFTTLGTPALHGRTFTVGPDSSAVEPEVILSHGLWQRRFGGNPDIVGQPISVDGERLTVIGVMPQGFAIRTTELAESRAELWMPFRLVPGDPTGMGGFLNVVARLASGVTPEQAEAELSLIAGRIEAAHPSYSHDWRVAVVFLHAATVKDVRLTLLVLFGAVAILLLIACANVANLILSRAETRQAELAIRLSLGATGGRLIRQMLTETIVLGAAGGAIGMLLSLWATRLLVSAVPAGGNIPRTGEIGVDLRVFAFASCVTFLTAILCGLVAPSVGAVRSAPQAALRQTLRSSSSGPIANRVGNILVMAEVALAMVLLAGAGLLARSFWELNRVDPGFRVEDVVSVRTTLPAVRYDNDDRIRAFSRELLDRIERLPEVRAVGFANYLPLNRFGIADMFEIEGRATARPGDQLGSVVAVVGGRYFEVMGIPLLRGRLPSDFDTDRTDPVFLVDEELARVHWPGSDPVGTRLVWRRGENETLSGTIVGVVGSVRYRGLAEGLEGTTYFWFPQNPGRQLTIVAHTPTAPATIAGMIAAQVAQIDESQPIAEILEMRDLVEADLARPRFTMLILGGFAAAALLMAVIGIYGVIAFGVSQRTREIGIRVALGAGRTDVLRLVVRRGVLLTSTGLALGVAGALGLRRVLQGLLYGVAPNDPVTLLAVALLLAVVAMLATYVPARRAMLLEPMAALKAE